MLRVFQVMKCLKKYEKDRACEIQNDTKNEIREDKEKNYSVYIFTGI